MESVKTSSMPVNRRLLNGISGHEPRNLNGLLSKPDKDILGKRLLPVVVDELARTSPRKIHESLAISSDLSQGFRDVTVSEMVNGGDCMAWKMQELFGCSDSFETVSYLGIIGPAIFHYAACIDKDRVPGQTSGPRKRNRC